MTHTTSDWVKKAEDDFIAARALLRRRKHPLLDAVGFHAQQTAEKYLKARLCAANLPIPKIHDCFALLHLTIPLEPLWTGYTPHCQRLTPLGTRFRYPGSSVTLGQARRAVEDAAAIRDAVRLSLGISNAPKSKLARKRKRR